MIISIFFLIPKVKSKRQKPFLLQNNNYINALGLTNTCDP